MEKPKFRDNLEIRKLKKRQGKPQMYSVRVNRRCDDGKWRFSPSNKVEASTDAEAFRQAQRYADELDSDSLTEEIVRNKRKQITVSDLIGEYKKMRAVQVGVGNLSTRTIKTEAHVLNAIDEQLGPLIFSSVKPSHIEEFYIWMVTEGYSLNKRHRVHSKLKVLFQMGITKGYRKNNPMDHIMDGIAPSKPKPNTLKQTSKRFTESDALDTITKLKLDLETSPDGYKMLMLIAFMTGLRRGEIQALTWNDLRQNNNGQYFFSVSKAMQPDGSISEPKTESSNRYVPIGKTLLYFLRLWNAKQKRQFEESGLIGYVDTNNKHVSIKGHHGKSFSGLKKTTGLKRQRTDATYICTSATGDPLGYYTFDRWRRRYLVTLKLEYQLATSEDGSMTVVRRVDENGKPVHISKQDKERIGKDYPTIHSLRKLYASLLHRQNVPTKDIQASLGHATMDVTENIYIYPEDDINTSIADIIDGQLTIRSTDVSTPYYDALLKEAGETLPPFEGEPHDSIISKNDYGIKDD